MQKLDQKDRYFVWYGSGAAALVLAYVLIFMGTSSNGLWPSLVTALANILPLVGLGLLVRPILKRFAGRPIRFVVSAVLGLAVLWSLSWYVAVALTIGLAGWLTQGAFSLVWLTGPALQWQAYQGLVVFALICVGHLAVTMGMKIGDLESQILHLKTQSPVPPVTTPTTMMVRTPEGLKALNHDDIVSIEAADDESMIITRNSTFPARTSLAQWAKQLEPTQFVRIHRSRLINLKRLISAEPIGDGRLIVHMEGGNSVEASRAGAQLIRNMAP